MSQVTEILSNIERGDCRSSEELLPLVYEELRRLAAQKLASENPGQTLQATALVHEAYARLVGGPQSQDWDSRGHFFASAAEAMRRILVEQARRKSGPKAGGDLKRVTLSGLDPRATHDDVDLVALSDALTRLAERDARAAEVVKLRYFAGMTIHETAQMLNISVSTANADWNYAKNWLLAELSDES